MLLPRTPYGMTITRSSFAMYSLYVPSAKNAGTGTSVRHQPPCGLGRSMRTLRPISAQRHGLLGRWASHSDARTATASAV